MKTTGLFVLAVLTLCSLVNADEGNGGYAGAFMQVPIGARPTAMGGAYIAVSNDGAGVLFNPAGVSNLTRPLLGSSYRFLQLDRKLGYVTVLVPVRGNSVLGGSWLYAGSGSVMARDRDGDPLGIEISHNNHAFSIVFAKRFEDYISVGMRASYLHSTFADMTAYTIGVNVGVVLHVDQLFSRERRDQLLVQDMQVGLVVKHLGSRYIWSTEDIPASLGGGAFAYEQQDEIPIEAGLGLSGRLLNKKLLLAADASKNAEQDVVLRGGAEFNVTNEFALRAGYGEERFTAGTGYIFQIGKKTLAIDYAFSTDRIDEGSEHIFSFDVLF